MINIGMHIKEISDVEILPKSSTPKADELGRALARQAIKRFGLGDEGSETDLKAKQMAAAFHQAMIEAIADEMKRARMKDITPGKTPPPGYKGYSGQA